MRAKTRTQKERMPAMVKIMFFTLAFLVLPVKPVFSSDDPIAFLVWRSSFTTNEITKLRGYGHKKDNQPVRITEYFLPANTNYARITITTTKIAENTAFQNLLSQGKVQKLQTIYIKSAYDGRLGGNVSWTETEDCRSAPGKYVCLPNDWEHDWTIVEISSP